MIDLAKLSVVPVTETEIITIGVVATLTMDLWQRFLQAMGLPRTNWGLVGRWVAGFPRGIFTHRPITATPKVRGPTLLSALAFAIALLVAPWFVMQPALGLGFIAARTPNPAAVRAINVSVHAVFGLGLYLGAVAWLVGAA